MLLTGVGESSEIALLHQIVNKESEFFDFCEPVNFLDLRLLASSLYPRLERIGRGMPNFDFVTEFAKDGMGLRLEYLLRQEQAYAVKKLSREVLDGGFLVFALTRSLTNRRLLSES